jgi:hypothetical protein
MTIARNCNSDYFLATSLWSGGGILLPVLRAWFVSESFFGSGLALRQSIRISRLTRVGLRLHDLASHHRSRTTARIYLNRDIFLSLTRDCRFL